MDEIKRLRALVADLAKQAQDIVKAAKADNDRELTEDEQAKVDEAIAKHAEAKADLEKAEAKARRMAAVAAMAPSRQAQAPEQHIQPQQSNDPVRVRVVRDEHEGDPTGGYTTPREFLMDVMHTFQTGDESARLRTIRETAGSDEQSTFADPYGGYLIPEGFSPALRQVGAEADPLAGRVTSIPMTAPSISFPARVDKSHSTSVSGGLTVSRRAEADTSASSRMEFEKITMHANGLFGISYATDEILTDSPISFAALLAAGFGDEFRSKIMNERINGTGVGQFTGVLNEACLVSVSKETGQAADTLVYDNLTKMLARVWRMGQAVWLINQTCIPQLMGMSVAVGTGGTAMIWIPSAQAGVPATLFGLPVVVSEYCSTLGDKGDIILGNWSQYIEATRTGLTGAQSIHVRFTTAETAFRFTMRNDGACWWRSALTPKNGDTLSPFVTLNARA